MKNHKDNLGIIGKKVGMTQIFDEENRLIPVTVVEAGPCHILQVKDQINDGYTAVQIGYRPQKGQRLSKAQIGHFKKADVDPLADLFEFRTEDTKEFVVGESILADQFSAGEKVDVIGTTKGRGFQGVVKRWNFGGGPQSHGSMSHRRGGSYGHCQWPGEVQKGKKMPGRMGNARRTAQNLVIVRVIEGKNLILIKGSFPGANGTLVRIRKAIKKKNKK